MNETKKYPPAPIFDLADSSGVDAAFANLRVTGDEPTVVDGEPTRGSPAQPTDPPSSEDFSGRPTQRRLTLRSPAFGANVELPPQYTDIPRTDGASMERLMRLTTSAEPPLPDPPTPPGKQASSLAGERTAQTLLTRLASGVTSDSCLLYRRKADFVLTRIDLTLDVIRIGRATEDNNILLNEEIDKHGVSRNHSVLVRRNNSWKIFDNGSQTGTYVNNQRILESGPLAWRTQIRIGRHVFRIFHRPSIEKLALDLLKEAELCQDQDPLTALQGPHEITRLVEDQIRKWARQGKPECTLALFRIDDIETLHRLHGEFVLDALTYEFARLFESHLPSGTELARYDDEHFLVWLPRQATSSAIALLEGARAHLNAAVYSAAGRDTRVPVRSALTQVRIGDVSIRDLFARLVTKLAEEAIGPAERVLVC